MKKTFFAICSLILLMSLLLCSCDSDGNGDLGAVTTAASTAATQTDATDTTQWGSSTKKDPTKFEEIDLSDANIEDFEETDEQTNYVVISVEGYGDILIRLFPEVAPITVNNFKTLVANKFYDGLIFHRVIENFMIQGGGYTTLGQEVPSPTIKGEFASNGFENNLAHVSGVISMARTNVKDSASSQFFIMHKTASHLDGQYAAFGYAADGRDVVDAIAKCSTNHNDMPVPSVVISSVRFVKEKEGIVGPLPGGNPGGEDAASLSWTEDVNNTTVYVRATAIWLRSDTNTSEATRVASAEFGQSFKRVKYNDIWTLIQVDQDRYYVKTDYITTDPGSVVFTDDAERTTVYITEDSLFLRTSTLYKIGTEKYDGNIGATVKKGDALTRVATSQNGMWIRVEYTYTTEDNQTRTIPLYCNADYTSATAPAFSSGSANPGVSGGNVVPEG